MADQATVVTAAGAVSVPTTLEAAQAALASERVRNTVLLNELASADETIANRDLQDFATVVTDASRPFWVKQLMRNRKEAIATLTDLAAAKKAAPAGGVVPAPMHNRATARPVVPAVVGGAGGGGEVDAKAGKIRNRAHEICAADRVPFSVAFRRAEGELSAQ